MTWWIGGLLLPACLIVGWYIVRRPLRQVVDDLKHEGARITFRRQRELLEARFVTALSLSDPIEGLHWEEARWQDEICWARDRRSRNLLALVGVHFDPSPYLNNEDPNQYATALFEYRKGLWRADGISLRAMLPHEACLRSTRFVAVVLPPPRVL